MVMIESLHHTLQILQFVVTLFFYHLDIFLDSFRCKMYKSGQKTEKKMQENKKIVCCCCFFCLVAESPLPQNEIIIKELFNQLFIPPLIFLFVMSSLWHEAGSGQSGCWGWKRPSRWATLAGEPETQWPSHLRSLHHQSSLADQRCTLLWKVSTQPINS